MTDGLTESMKMSDTFNLYKCSYCGELHDNYISFVKCLSSCAIIYGMKPLTEFGMVLE